MPQIRVCIPTKLTVHAHTMESLFKCYNIPNYTIDLKFLVGKSNIDQARSMMISRWYEEPHADDDLFLFIDSDQIFENADLRALINLNSDVAIGVYRGFQWACCRPYDWNKFITGESNDVMYGATGFMMIRRPILRRLEAFIRDEQMGLSHCYVSPDYPSVIPFFRQRIVVSEVLTNGNTPVQEWLGEDYAFCWMVRKVGGNIKCHLSPTIAHEITDIKYFYPPEYKKKVWGQKTIAYYLGNSNVLWNPLEMNLKGLGGSETAVVYLTKYWKEMGYTVVVYGNVVEGNYDGIEYLETSKMNLNDEFNIVILWRSFGLEVLKYVNARQIIVDLHDELTPNHQPLLESINKVSMIMVKSQYHKSLFGGLFEDKIKVLQNGIPDYYLTTKNIEEIPKNRYKLIYSSFYTRGLQYMLMWGWSIIKNAVPEAELHIFYGTETVDPKFLQMMRPLLAQDGVYEHGKVGQRELYQQKLSSSIYYYAGCRAEVDCINVKEAIYANCLPVVCNITAMREKNYCLKINGEPENQATQVEAAQMVVRLMKDQEFYKNTMDEMKKHLDEVENWKDLAKKWTEHFSY